MVVSEVVLISQPDIPLGPSQMIKMTVRKMVKVELRKDDKLQKMLQMMLSQLLWPRVRLWHQILEGKGPHPSTNLQWLLLNHAATPVNYRRCKDRLQNSRLGWPKKRADRKSVV